VKNASNLLSVDRVLRDCKQYLLFGKQRRQRLFRGVFDSFAQAAASAPRNRKIGYDHPECAHHLENELDQIIPCDYPMLFWLKSILTENARLFDFGGNVGLSFFSYKKNLAYPPGFQWQVFDVPEVVKAGRELARQRESAGLSFTTDFSDAENADILLAAGSIQFVETPLAKLLAGLVRKPRHLLINKLPLYEGAPFVTLQSLGPAFCQYHVFNKAQFISSISTCGYTVMDDWQNAELSCRIPFHPNCSCNTFSGLYARRSD
jgi:putative methyltransferase (TIGR04325 family)